MMNTNDSFIEYQLIHSSPDSVFKWLQDNSSKKLDLFDGEKMKSLEKSLLGRKDKLINLGLALYGRSPQIAYHLFSKGDETIRRACCAGKSVSSDLFGDGWVCNKEALPAMLRDWDSNLLSVLLSNPNLPDEVLVHLFEKTEPFNQLDEERWMLLLAFVSRNERISKPYVSDWMDGLTDYLYNKVFYSAWEAFGTVTPTACNATVMSSLGEKLVSRKPINCNVMELIDRWRSNDDEKDKNLGYARAVLTKILDGDERTKLRLSDDIALRKGFYAYHEYYSAEEVIEDFEKDGIEFLDSALANESVFRKAEVRSAYRRCCWDAPDKSSRLDYPNFFNARENYWKSKHPEWFKEIYDEDYPIEAIEGFEPRVERRLARINMLISDIRNTVIGNVDENQPGLKDAIFSETQVIAEFLLKIYRQNFSALWWGIAGLVIGFLVAKVF